SSVSCSILPTNPFIDLSPLICVIDPPSGSALPNVQQGTSLAGKDSWPASSMMSSDDSTPSSLPDWRSGSGFCSSCVIRNSFQNIYGSLLILLSRVQFLKMPEIVIASLLLRKIYIV